MTKSSYYTGHSEIDDALLELYDEQAKCEAEASKLTKKSGEMSEELQKVTEKLKRIHFAQDFLLELGKQMGYPKDGGKVV